MTLREEEVIGKVREALAHAPGVDSPKINITFMDGQVLLAGVLDTAEEVARAAQVARQAVPSVKLDNSLTFSPGHSPHAK